MTVTISYVENVFKSINYSHVNQYKSSINYTYLRMEENSKKLCVVIDTNTWIQESNILLKTPLGGVLLYYLKQNNGYLGLYHVR
ncbi:MAG: hypothetical protein F6K17_12095 [Okeania sp. SIO3C4]|nr:hypothetical protein [Okeania sp. SIO3C4]